MNIQEEIVSEHGFSRNVNLKKNESYIAQIAQNSC